MVSMSKIFSKNKSATWFWRNTPNTSATTVQQRDSLFNSSNWVLQVHIRTSPDASPENVGVFVGSDPTDSVTAPCTRFKKGEDRRKKERSFTSIKMLHTHTRPEPGQPWKARGRKKRTHEGQTAKNSAGGRGTDGPPEPTYTAKRTWQKQRTHRNPTTHYGEARGEIRDQMGD